MLSLTHAAVGGAVGGFIANPAVAFGAGILSHIIIDKVPHYWPKSPKYQGFQIVLDSIATLIMLYFLFSLEKSFFSPIFWGAAGGAFVDFMLVLVFKLHPKLWNSKLRLWHTNRQPHRVEPFYIVTDIVQIMAGIMAIWFLA